MTVPERAAPAPGRVAILGAGPVGLEAALAAADARLPFIVFESSPAAGGNVSRWGHVRLFTPWSMNISQRMARHLRRTSREVPGGAYCPTGAELVADLLAPVVHLPELRGHIHYGTRVIGVARAGLLKHDEIGTSRRSAGPFRIVAAQAGRGMTAVSANLVLDCTGNYANPNAAGDGGVPAPGEAELGDAIVRVLPDVARERDEWAGRTVLLIGAGKSAQTAARDLANLLPSAPGTRVIWAVRSTHPNWGEVPDDPLPERQALADCARRIAAGQVPGVRVELGATVDAFNRENGQVLVRLNGPAGHSLLVDRVLALTGYVPDATIYRQLQVHECYATEAPFELSAQLLGEAAADCLKQRSYGIDVLRSPEPDFFVLGAKSYGRNSQFLMHVGYEQVSEVIGAYVPEPR